MILFAVSANEKLSGIHRSPTSPEETVANLSRCVEHLEQQGVDTAGIQPDQLAAGNLKATLMLMNNIRKRYDVSTQTIWLVKFLNEFNGAYEWCFRPWFCTVRLYCTRDNLG